MNLSGSRRRIDRDRDLTGSVSSRAGGDISHFLGGPNSSSSPLSVSTEDLSIMSSRTRSISPKINVNSATSNGLSNLDDDNPDRS